MPSLSPYKDIYFPIGFHLLPKFQDNKRKQLSAKVRGLPTVTKKAKAQLSQTVSLEPSSSPLQEPP